MGNNNTINGPSYYRLPCGRQLEDYMMQRNYPGPMWDAVAYRYRAGKKDGEPFAKDFGKVRHYCELMASWSSGAMKLRKNWIDEVREEVALAVFWDGKTRVDPWLPPYGGLAYKHCAKAQTSNNERFSLPTAVRRTLKFVRLDPRAKIPSYAHEGDSGMDICALGDDVVLARGRLKVKTGIAAVIPEGYELQVRPRSGLQFNRGVCAGFGTVDRGYTGEICVVLFNMTDVTFTVRAGDRIAQLVLAPVEHARIEEADRLPDTDRGDNGFGSTGL